MLTILAFADIHSSDLQLPDVQPNVVVLLGDIGWEDIERIDKVYSCPKLGVHGNHDRAGWFDDTAICNLHGQRVTIGNAVFGGFGGAKRYSDEPFGQFEEWEAETALRQIGHTDVFLAHDGPPAGQRTGADQAHQGCEAFAAYISAYKPSYFLHGHMHENKQYNIGLTQVTNVYGVQILRLP